MAANYARELLDHSRRHFLPLWNAYGSVFHRIVAIRSGDLDGGVPVPHVALSELAGPNVTFRFLTGLIELAEALTHAGRIADGLAVVEAGMEQSEAAGSRPNCYASKASSCYCRGPLQARKRRRTSSGRRWTERAGKRPCPGSCVLRQASRACCVIRVDGPKPLPASVRSMTDLRRGSAPPIWSQPNSFWMKRTIPEHPVKMRFCEAQLIVASKMRHPIRYRPAEALGEPR